MSTAPNIAIRDLRVGYGKNPALHGVSLEVRPGETFGFIGPNGAGKSTTIKALLGLIPVYQGEIRLYGLSPDDPASRRRVGYLAEEAKYYPYLTPLETLEFYGRVCGLPKKERLYRAERLLDLVGLLPFARRRLSTLSKGTVQRVGLAQVLMNDPDTLVLDEPTSGLDPLGRLELHRILNDLKKKGKTVFFSSHELSEVELLCDSIAILKDGRIVRRGALEQVLGGREGHLERFFLEVMKESS